MVNRERMREYAKGSLWVLPGTSAVAALLVGFGMSRINISADSPLAPLVFQGTADDARTLLADVTNTVITVIALVMGLTVVALQLSSTQFSPRLLRNFLRDRPNQVVLSIFVATFAYSAAGLYTVGVAAGNRTQDYPRLAVSGSMLLLFASLGAVVYFADHLAHSIQVDAIGKGVESATVSVARRNLGSVEFIADSPPPWALPLAAGHSGYLQAVHPEALLPLANRYGLHIRMRPRVGEHVVEGTLLGWMWTPSPEQPCPDPDVLRAPLDEAVRVGFERTLEQDAAFGIRQLVDMACKALSPAVNDPYTAVQAVDHLSVIFCALAARPLGDYVASDPRGDGVVIVPGRRFGDYLSTMCGLIRRYGVAEPTLGYALIRLLASCSEVVIDDPARWSAIERERALVLDAMVAGVRQPEDLDLVRAASSALQEQLAPHLALGAREAGAGGADGAGGRRPGAQGRMVQD